jgi:ribonuclease HI
VKAPDVKVSSKGKEHCNKSDNKEVAIVPRWEPPPAGWFKVNVDGSFVDSTGDATIGAIAREHRGAVIFTAWCTLSWCASAAEAEAKACAEGLRLATQWARESVIIETDCARVAQALRSNVDRSEISFIIAEAREHAQLLVSWHVAQVKRECNVIAHELAHLARRSFVSSVSLGQAPACVMAQVVSDCTSIPA